MKEILEQFTIIWQQIKPLQKIFAITLVSFVIGTLGYLVLQSSTKTVLSSRQQIEFEAPKSEPAKGFELFDSNTWIKGDREVQVLEMRALKGQLERDLSSFEPIKSASVILDIPPSETFHQASPYKTKASVILTLIPGARLSSSHLAAITNHLACAVRGLETDRIAISDSKGRLYKTSDPMGKNDPQETFEEEVRGKMDPLLTKIVGQDHFHTHVQTKEERHTLAITIDRSIVSEQSQQAGMERQLRAIVCSFDNKVEPLIEFLSFAEESNGENEIKKGEIYILWALLSMVIVVVALHLFLSLRKKRGNTDKRETDPIVRLMAGFDPHLLVNAIAHETPATIAMMISYLQPEKAEEMLTLFPEKIQDDILTHLFELEKGER